MIVVLREFSNSAQDFINKQITTDGYETSSRGTPAFSQSLPRYITLLGTLPDSNPEIADYVRDLVQLELPDFTDRDVPRSSEKFHRIQSFQLIGGDPDWRALHPTLRESLSHNIYLRSLTRLDISY